MRETKQYGEDQNFLHRAQCTVLAEGCWAFLAGRDSQKPQLKPKLDRNPGRVDL